MNLPQPVAVGIWVVLGIVLLALVVRGRRRMTVRSVGVVPTPPAVPAPEARGAVVLGPLDALYVSSTLEGDWLARVGAHGLGDRAQGEVTVHDGGLHVARRGAPDLWVPATAVRGGALTPGMAGKFVGKEAIVVVTWSVPAEPVPAAGERTPGETATPAADPQVRLDTGIMPRHEEDVARLLDAVRALAGEPPVSTPPAEAEPAGRTALPGERAERRTGAPSSAPAAPADQDGPTTPRDDAASGTDQNDKEAL